MIPCGCGAIQSLLLSLMFAIGPACGDRPGLADDLTGHNVTALISLLDDKDLAAAAAQELARRGEPAIDALIQVIREPLGNVAADSPKRRHAVAALGKMGGTAVQRLHREWVQAQRERNKLEEEWRADVLRRGEAAVRQSWGPVYDWRIVVHDNLWQAFREAGDEKVRSSLASRPTLRNVAGKSTRLPAPETHPVVVNLYTRPQADDSRRTMAAMSWMWRDPRCRDWQFVSIAADLDVTGDNLATLAKELGDGTTRWQVLSGGDPPHEAVLRSLHSPARKANPAPDESYCPPGAFILLPDRSVVGPVRLPTMEAADRLVRSVTLRPESLVAAPATERQRQELDALAQALLDVKATEAQQVDRVKQVLDRMQRQQGTALAAAALIEMLQYRPFLERLPGADAELLEWAVLTENQIVHNVVAALSHCDEHYQFVVPALLELSLRTEKDDHAIKARYISDRLTQEILESRVAWHLHDPTHWINSTRAMLVRYFSYTDQIFEVEYEVRRRTPRAPVGYGVDGARLRQEIGSAIVQIVERQPAAIDDVLRARHYASKATRLLATQVLAATPANRQRAVAALIELLSDPEQDISTTAGAAVALQGQSAIPLLIDGLRTASALESGPGGVSGAELLLAQWARESKLRPADVNRLVQYGDDSSLDLRLASVRLLQFVAPEKSAAIARQMLDVDSDTYRLRAAALLMVAGHRDEAVYNALCKVRDGPGATRADRQVARDLIREEFPKRQ